MAQSIKKKKEVEMEIIAKAELVIVFMVATLLYFATKWSQLKKD